MHSTMLLLLFVLFVDGVSGADPDETLTVREGDSVPLHTGLTEILNDDTIVWMFVPNSSLISQITRKKNVTSFFVTDDVGFRGRLQVDQNTGSLIIRNTRERHSGQYQVTISSRKTTSKTFNFIVQRVASGTGGVKSVPVSVMEGEPVTLNPYPTQIHRDDLVLWTFGDILLAKIDVENKQISLHDADEGYRGRLQLDQTGSLTITNTRTTDSGHYHLQIRGSESSQQFILTVSQPGLSSGAVAGIVLVFLAAAVAAAAAGFIYYRRKISELRKQILPVPVTVKEGEDVTLKPNKTIQKGDVILWMFEYEEQRTSIAKFIGETGEFVKYDDAVDGRFSGTLDLNKTTGSLTIRKSRPAHSGLYTLYIISSSGDSKQRFIVTVKENEDYISVDERGSVTLNCNFERLDDDLMLWTFGDQDRLIAEIRGKTAEIYYYDAADERFRDRLKLEKKTGSLTITDIKAEHTGLYKLQTFTSRGTLCKRFRVYIPLERVFVTAGESVHLSTDHPEIERGDEIQWRCGDEIIAEIKGGAGETHDGADERFRDRLQLNDQTGDLTIKNSTTEDKGDYKLKISSSKGNTDKTYSVGVTVRCVFVTAGESVHLSTDRPEIERDDEIQWMCGDEIIAEIKGGTGKTHDGADERFRDRLQLNDQTGDLTIKNSTTEDKGDYKLKISSSKGNTDKTYSVFITVRCVFVTAGESVHLSTDRPKIERDDVIQWRCGGEIIAEVKEGTGETHDGAEGRFRDRLQLDKRTGDLTINDSTDEDEGYYKLKIRSRKVNKNKTYSVGVTGRDVFVTEGESVRLPTGRHKIERDDVIQWRCGGEIIAEIKGGTRKTHDGADERFRDRLQLDKRTGDLTIKSSTDEDTGRYKLKIRSRKGNTTRVYHVIIRGRCVFVTEGESVRLSTDRPKIERDDEIQWRCGGEIIAEVKEGETHDGADERFRDRLQLDKRTGDLTINDSTDEDTGRYKLKISNKTYSVGVTVREESPVKGNNDESAVEIPLLDK